MTTDCREVEALLLELLDGRLPAPEGQRVRAHAESCARCGASLRRWQHTVPALRGLEPDPLPELALRRMELAIEHQLQTVPDRPRLAWLPRWRWPTLGIATAGVLVVLGAILIAGWPRSPVYGRLGPSSGQVLVDDHSVTPGTSLSSGTSLALAEGTTSLSLGRDIRAELHGRTRLTLLGDNHAVRVSLHSGELSVALSKRRAEESFVVETPQGRVEVRGTRFTVGFAGEGVWVRVDEGRVAAFRAHRPEAYAIGAGETFWLAPEIPDVSPPAAQAPQEHVPAVEPAAPAVQPAAPFTGADCETATARVRAAMRAGQADRALRLLEQPTGAASQRCRDEVGYLRAEALRAAGRMREAIAAYLKLDRRGAEPAMRQNALFAAGELEQRGGHHQAAYVRFEGALAVAPRGGLREEAMAGAMAAAWAAHDEALAVAAAQRYLREYPQGNAAGRAGQILRETASPR